jgi:Fe2+ transport system protein FeoA
MSSPRDPNSDEAALCQLSNGEEGLISRVAAASPELKRRLYALGFVPGASVTKLRVAPLGDPLQVRVGGSSVSIRAREAAAILVQPRPPSNAPLQQKLSL